MEDLTFESLVVFDDSLNKNSSSNIASNIHPRLDAYKKSSSFCSNQEERRRNLLIEQKCKRQKLTNANRDLKDEEVKAPLKKNSNQSGKWSRKVVPQYNNQLMLSEWLEEAPFDFETNWIMVLCPVGKRCLIVASDGITTAYNKAGRMICKHPTKLPGGNRDSKTDYTILDCIFNYELQTYYVIDVLVYKSHPVVDSETEFRFFWLKCKLDEAKDLDTSYYGNPYKFKDLPRSCKSTDALVQSVIKEPFEFEIDGILFYHKEAHYTPGHTPLSLWLKAYMLPEILNIPIPQWIQDKTPSDYKGYKDIIRKSNIEQEKINIYLKNKDKNDSSAQQMDIIEVKDKMSSSEFSIRHFNSSSIEQ